MVEISQDGYFSQKLSLFFQLQRLIRSTSCIESFVSIDSPGQSCLPESGKTSFGSTTSSKVPQNYLYLWTISRFSPTFSSFEFCIYALRSPKCSAIFHEVAREQDFWYRNDFWGPVWTRQPSPRLAVTKISLVPHRWRCFCFCKLLL